MVLGVMRGLDFQKISLTHVFYDYMPFKILLQLEVISLLHKELV